jgi:protein TonB
VRYAVAWALAHLGPSSDLKPPTGETPPRPTRQKRPEYPKRAFAAGIEGTVLVKFLVGEQGEVAHLEIRRSIPELDAAAAACLRKWTFEPGRVGGVARPVVAQSPVTFRVY